MKKRILTLISILYLSLTPAFAATWSAKLVSAVSNRDTVTIIIQYSDDSQNPNIFQKTYQIGAFSDPNFVAKQAAQEISSLQSADNYAASLTPGNITPFVEPAPSEIDTFFSKTCPKYRALQVSVSSGFLQANDQSVIDATTDVKTALSAHPEYQQDPRWLQK